MGFRFSNAAYLCFGVWAVLQAIGAHYTFESLLGPSQALKCCHVDEWYGMWYHTCKYGKGVRLCQ